MMETELIELFEAVKKASDAAAADSVADSSPEEDRCLDALERLKKYPVNYHLLVSTQVGKRLRHLTKHPKRKIQSLASNLIDIWKNIIVEETKKNKKNGSLGDKDSIKSEPVHGGTSEATKIRRLNSVKVERVSKVESVKLQKTNSSHSLKSEKVIMSEAKKIKNVDVVKIEKNVAGECTSVESITKGMNHSSDVRKPTLNAVSPPKLSGMILCQDPLRNKVRELVSEALRKVSNEIGEDLRDEANACDPYRVAVNLESTMFEKWGKSTGAQKFKYRSILFNIKDPQNPDFRRKILLGRVNPEAVLEMTPEEMASDERQRKNEEIKNKALFDCERGGAPKATTDAFKCNRCGKKECTYYQMQTRSADEPMTTYVTCVNCNNHWKFC